MSFTDYYNDMCMDPNNLSNWYPKVKDCGIRQPKTFIKKVPEEIVKAFFMEDYDKDTDKIYHWVKEDLIAGIPKDMSALIFLKNGGFSNKFDAGTCLIRTDPITLTRALIEINYNALLLGADGCTEAVIRDRIPSDNCKTPCIYNGLPLQNEYRVFYDFDKKEVLYAVNYWDPETCQEAISRNATDKIIYEHVIGDLIKHYNEKVAEVKDLCRKHLNETEGLTGIWSVDILEDHTGEFWLIDMALAFTSAYWDPAKIEK